MPPKKAKRSAKESVPRAQLGNARIEKYYNKIVAVFIGLTALLLVLIVYFSFSKTTITVKAEDIEETISAKTTVKEMDGTVLLTTVDGSKSYQGVETSVATPGKATGTVTLVNNHNQSQPLVANTRLLSKEDVLFRTQETVTVPAGGSIDVAVTADQEGASGNIAASTFEIVALWDGLKDKIYGTSTEAMTGGLVYATTVTAEDISKAKSTLTNELLAEAEEIFTEELSKRSGLPTNAYIPKETLTIVETVQNDVNAKEGDTVDQVTATQKLTIAVVVLSKDTVVEKATLSVEEQIKKEYEGMTLSSNIVVEDVVVKLSELGVDRTDGTLTLTVTTPLKLNASNDLFEKKRLTAKTKSDVQKYFAGKKGIKSVDVDFSPFWVKKTPAFADNIQIIVK